MSNMVVRTNIFSLNAHRNMKNVGLEQQRASNRLASGFRINSAADDAAGLAISETMRAQIRGLDQASRNAQDGQALIQVAEGGLQEIQNILQRVRELAVQGANDTNAQSNREQIALEVRQLAQEMAEMSRRVEFNGMAVLDSVEGRSMEPGVLNPQQQFLTGNALSKQSVFGNPDLHAGLFFQIGANSGQGMMVQIDLSRLQPRFPYNISRPGDGFLFNPFESMSFSIEHVALALHGAHGPHPFLGYRWDHNYSGQQQDDVWEWAGVFPEERPYPYTDPAVVPPRTEAGPIRSQSEWISRMIDMVGGLVNEISLMRAELGAISNRLDFTMRSLDISSENLSDAESRVRNADMAREMMRFTMSNVLQQASVSMLAQANQLPNNLLQLLR